MKVINVKKASTALVLGSIISCLALSGCGMSNSKQNSEKDIETGTAILVENKDAILIKLYEPNYNGYRTSAIDRYIILGTASGDKILVDQRSVQIIIGENSICDGFKIFPTESLNSSNPMIRMIADTAKVATYSILACP